MARRGARESASDLLRGIDISRSGAGLSTTLSVVLALSCGSDSQSTHGSMVDDGGMPPSGSGGSAAGGSVPVIPLVGGPELSTPCRWLSPGIAKDLAFSPDGALLATGSGGFVKLYEAASGASARATPWHPGSVNTFSFHPSMDSIAVGISGDETGIFVYELTDMSVVSRLVEGRAVSSVAYSADGSWLAAAVRSDSQDFDDVIVWNAEDFETQATLSTEEYDLTAVGFAPDGSTLFASGYNAYAWSTADWQSLRDPTRSTMSSAALPTPRMVFSNDGRRAYLTSFTAASADPGDGGFALNFNSPEDADLTVAIQSHDGTLVAAGDTNGRVFLWEVSQGAPLLYRFAAQQDDINALAFSPDDAWLAATSQDGTVFTWRVRDGQERWHAGAPLHPRELVAASRDGSKVLLKSTFEYALVSGDDGEPLGKFDMSYGDCVTDDMAERLACANREGPNFAEINGVPRTVGIEPSPEIGPTSAVALVPGARTFVQGLGFRSETAITYAVRFWDLDDETFRDIPVPNTPRERGIQMNVPTSFAFSDDARWLLGGINASYSGVGSPPRQIGYLWEANSGELRATFGAYATVSPTAEFAVMAPDGSWGALGDPGIDELVIFDVSDRRERRLSFEGAIGFEHLAVSPDGRLLAAQTVASPRTETTTMILVIDVDAEAIVFALRGRSERALAFLSNNTLARGEVDGATSVWCLD